MNRLTTNSPFSLDFALLVLRVCTGAMMLFGHGIGKIGRFFEEPVRFGDPIGIGTVPSLILATIAEVLCSILIIIGFKMRLALIPLLVTMFVAAVITHLDDPWGRKELPFLYLVTFITLFLSGPGKYSLDHKVESAREWNTENTDLE